MRDVVNLTLTGGSMKKRFNRLLPAAAFALTATGGALASGLSFEEHEFTQASAYSKVGGRLGDGRNGPCFVDGVSNSIRRGHAIGLLGKYSPDVPDDEIDPRILPYANKKPTGKELTMTWLGTSIGAKPSPLLGKYSPDVPDDAIDPRILPYANNKPMGKELTMTWLGRPSGR